MLRVLKNLLLNATMPTLPRKVNNLKVLTQEKKWGSKADILYTYRYWFRTMDILFCHLVKHKTFYHKLSIKHIVSLNSTGNFVFCVFFYFAATNL
jgi:hypothetical protein